MATTFTRLVYHIIFSTRDRAPSITDDLRPRLYAYIGGMVRAEHGTMLEIGGVADHVHLLVGLKPSRSLSDVVRAIKGGSSRWVNGLPGTASFAWQSGFGAFSVSVSNLDAVALYVRRQEEHHRRRTFPGEIEALCSAHKIEAPGRPA